MNDSELCRRIAARYAYLGGEKKPSWFDRLIGPCLPCVIIWGTVAFCIALMVLQKRLN